MQNPLHLKNAHLQSIITLNIEIKYKYLNCILYQNSYLNAKL